MAAKADGHLQLADARTRNHEQPASGDAIMTHDTHDQADDNIETRHLCPLPHRGHATQIHPPATICHHHTEQLHHRITDITRLWDQLDDLAQTARNGNNQTGSKSQAPTRLDIIALRDPHTHDDGDIPNATRILTDAANWIAEQRRLTHVTTPEAALELLRVHYLALTDDPDITDTWHGITRIWNTLRSLSGESPRELGRTCNAPHPDPQADADQCGGPIWTTGRVEGVVAACRDCGNSITDTAVILDMMQRAAATTRFTATHINLDTA